MLMTTGSLPESGPRELLLWLLRLRKRVAVTGRSMIPNFQPGDEILVDLRAYRQEPPQAGDIVLAFRPDRTDVTMIKRVASVAHDGRLILLGDNPAASTDSRSFGPVPPANILGKATSKFA
jgi:nickel-type superoxide dismutase maturation protease